MLTCKDCIHREICLSYVGFEGMYYDETIISEITTGGIIDLCDDFELDWMSPNDMLPKDGERVLVKDSNGNIGIAQFRQYQITPTSPIDNRWLGCNSAPKLWKPIS